MFVGEFTHAIDEKNRLVLPSKFRAFINDPEDKKGFFIVASPVSGEHCLRLYTMSGWKLVAAKLRERGRGPSVSQPVNRWRAQKVSAKSRVL